jgi:hypothetical protein
VANPPLEDAATIRAVQIDKPIYNIKTLFVRIAFFDSNKILLK